MSHDDRNEIPSPSGEPRATSVSPGVDPCEGMAQPAAGDASDSQHGLPQPEQGTIRPGNPGGVITTGKLWTDSEDDFDFEHAELLISTDGREMDVAIPGPDDRQRRMIVSVPYSALLAALLAEEM